MPSMPSRPPRAAFEPITSASDAWTVFDLSRHRPPRHETIALVLDHRRCGHVIAVIKGTHRPDDVLGVAAVVGEAAATSGVEAAIVLASFRPGAPAGPTDTDRWFRLDAMCEHMGVRLVEWFVHGADGRDAQRIGERAGERSRWAPGS